MDNGYLLIYLEFWEREQMTCIALWKVARGE